MRRFALPVILLLFCLSLASAGPGFTVKLLAAAKETCISIRSKNFLLVGNATEPEIRKVAAKLEQFRDVFSRLFPKANLNSPVPITVMVFKNRQSYLPFMPTYQGKINEVSGYFQAGQDVSYITLAAELNQEDTFKTIFHEYVHALTNNTTASAPPWFSEGLAEFYSTFEVTDGDKKVFLGKPISDHVYLLRDNKFLPLPKLFAVEHSSPDYNERDKKGVFYAESWALVHYLILGNNGQRRPQFIKYVDMLLKDRPVDESFKEAFQTDYATMERELKNYIGRNTYPVQIFSYEQKLAYDDSMQNAPISEAQWNYYLGDLVLHLNRADSEEYLQKAVQLDPNLAVAHASLGMAHMKANRFAEAKESLQRALAIGPQNHLVHYYHAFVLSREGMDPNRMVRSYAPEVAQTMREHLKKAIGMAPEFAESYNLLAFVNMVMGEEPEESVDLLKSAIALSPGRQDFSLMLAQIYLRQQRYDDAERIAEQISRGTVEPHLRERAQLLLETIKSVTERVEHLRAEERGADGAIAVPTDGKTSPLKKRTDLVLRRHFEGEKVRGMLTEIRCSDRGLTLLIQDGDRFIKLHTTTPEQVPFISFTSDSPNQINCGKVDPSRLVIVTYRRSAAANAAYDGEPVAVEFIKPEEQ
ncbi:MAG TPA: tetratricopeptide repeat protein [Blastocatellia bacterium]|nr:tetratricopeptide repeat protein [Blastocatellia bacterium]